MVWGVGAIRAKQMGFGWVLGVFFTMTYGHHN